MKSPDAGGSPEPPPVDPGCLPAWSVGEMPAPVPFGWKNLLALIGPGLVMVGGTIGTGEWVQGAGVAALYRGALLWVAPIAILCQVMLNTEAMRYTLVTGEPVFTGFMRSKPGPRFWLLYYLCLDCMSWWPSMAGLAAQILLFTIFRTDPTPEHVRWTSCGILAACGLLLCFGGKIYNTLEVVLSGKVLFVLAYLLFATVVFAPPSAWSDVVGGMTNPFRPLPPNVDWGLIGGVVGFAGIGGLGNILASNYVREKGWGMGAMVGAIPSAVGGSCLKLSHLGTICRPTPEAQERFNKWWGYVKLDQFGLWAWGSVVGMMLPCVLGAAYLKSNYFQQKGREWAAAAALAQDFGAERGQLFTVLTLICGIMILFPGQLSSMDGIARRWCDAFWSGSRRIRAADSSRVRTVYYSFVAAYVTAGFCLNSLGISAPKMMVISGNMANLSLLCTLLHTLYVNRRFLPPEFRPSTLKCAGLVLAACFYAGIFGLVSYQLILKLQAGKLF